MRPQVLYGPGGLRTALPATPIIQRACDGALPADGMAAKQASLPPRQR